MMRLSIFILIAMVTGCSSGPKGVECPGEVSTIYGQSMGHTQGVIFDLVNSFTVTRDKVSVKSGPLQSLDRFKYVPPPSRLRAITRSACQISSSA